MLESYSLALKFPDGVSESKVRKIRCRVVAEVQDNEIKPHNVATYLLSRNALLLVHQPWRNIMSMYILL